MSGRIVIVMGSKSDLDHVEGITAQLDAWDIPYDLHVGSAHKSVRHVLRLLQDYENADEPIVYITVAGRSNALGGMVDTNTAHPVITCPPISSTFAGADIYSSLRMPSGVAPLVVLAPEGAALAAAKMLALSDDDLRATVTEYQKTLRDEVLAADEEVYGTS
ncbi:MAG: AIR carboxylase family protein [Anaerolineales bacterium]